MEGYICVALIWLLALNLIINQEVVFLFCNFVKLNNFNFLFGSLRVSKAMSREELINDTVEKLRQLSDSRIQEVSDYVSFLASKIDDKIILEGIKTLASSSKSYDFLRNEDDLYQLSDVKEKYQ